MPMSVRSRKTAERDRERMRAEAFERESGDAALQWVLPTSPPLRNDKAQSGRGRAPAPAARATQRPE
jgi:hypothetical protein